MFDNQTLLITGGTGSFGNAVLNRFLKTDDRRNTDFFHPMKKIRISPVVSFQKTV